MKFLTRPSIVWLTTLSAAVFAITSAQAAPTVTRLTPPSELFSRGQSAPIIARFLPGQRFDIQATVRPDDASKTITSARFTIDGKVVRANVAIKACETFCKKDIPVNAAIVSSRAISVSKPGIHQFSISATQSDGQTVTTNGNFEVVRLVVGGQRVKKYHHLVG